MTYGYSRTTEGSAGHANEVVFRSITTAPTSQIIAHSNGTTGFDALRTGTVLGKITATAKFRPCAKQIVSGTPGSVTVVAMGSVNGFYVGDVVTAWDISGAVALATGRTVTAVDRVASPPTLTISAGAITYAAGDYIFVEDGSGTAVGLLRAGVAFVDGTDALGAVRRADQGGLNVFDAVVDEVEAARFTTLNTYIKADLINALNGCTIIFK